MQIVLQVATGPPRFEVVQSKDQMNGVVKYEGGCPCLSLEMLEHILIVWEGVQMHLV